MLLKTLQLPNFVLMCNPESLPGPAAKTPTYGEVWGEREILGGFFDDSPTPLPTFISYKGSIKREILLGISYRRSIQLVDSSILMVDFYGKLVGR